MRKRKEFDDLTEEELQRYLMEKKNTGREARILAYRASGRVVEEESAPINKEFEYNLTQKRKLSGKKSERNGWDVALLIIEILAVLGIIVILILGTQLLSNMNQKAKSDFLLPTLTPTPLIRAVVLPGGHTPPDENGSASFNESEIPEHLRGLVESSFSVPVISPEIGQIIRIRIPSINVDAPVVQGDDWETLKKGVGVNSSSVSPGQIGNVILSGHNDVFGQVFKNLDQLNDGDEIFLLTEKNSYSYKVQNKQIVQPDQVEVLSQTSDATVTLISCYPYLIDNQRIVITGKLE